MINNPLWELEEAFEQVGTAMYPMSDEDCCKLLAWLLKFGGSNEQVVSDQVLNCRIRKAQKRMNVFGGEVPNAELTMTFQKFCRELRVDGLKTVWLKELYRNYKIKFPKLEV